MKNSLILAVGLGVSALSSAATIAVIDSGLDTQHDMIESKLWFNPMEIEEMRSMRISMVLQMMFTAGTLLRTTPN